MTSFGPLSLVFANLFMEYFESVLLLTLPVQSSLRLQYADDVLALWPSEQSLEGFVNRFNSLSPSIKFTVEREDGNKLPFLDTSVHRPATP